MGHISLQAPVVGQSDATEEPKIVSDLALIQALLNGNVDTTNLSATAAIAASQLATAISQTAGLNDGTTVRRGKCIIPGEETRTSTAYGLMPTPDRVQSLVLPTDGLFAVVYQALWKTSGTAANTRAAIFLNSNQLVVRRTAAIGPMTQAACQEDTSIAGNYSEIDTCPLGLVSHFTDGVVTGGITTGQAIALSGNGNTAAVSMAFNDVQSNVTSELGGVCLIRAAAGTYDVSVQFKQLVSGTLSVKERRLWVWTIGF